MEDRTIRRYPLSRQVADRLEQMIAEGKYPVGQKINTETELTEIFGVSRNTVREAVQSLTSAGVLEVRQGDGTYVRADNRFSANMSLKYAEVSPEDVTETRNALEVTLAHLAAKRRTEEDLRAIEAALRRRQALEEPKENTRADLLFHQAIAEASHNTMLCDLYRSIEDYLEGQISERQAETSFRQEEIDRLHEELFFAIRDKDQAKARHSVQNILKI